MSVMTQLWRRWRRPTRRGGSLEFVPGGWQAGESLMTLRGWNADSVVRIQAEAWEHWKRPLRTPDPFGTGLAAEPQLLGLHNTLVSFAYVAALAAIGQARLSLLDWGGGAGQYGWLAEAALPGVTIDYHCKDVPVQSEAGRQAYPRGTFFERDEEFAGSQFDLVLASGALHYVADWRAALQVLAAATSRYLFVTRLPTVARTKSFVVLQCAYQSEYLGWTLNRDEFLEAALGCGLHWIREFPLDEFHRARGAPEASRSRGFLFRRD